jgi:hypothetical protein
MKVSSEEGAHSIQRRPAPLPALTPPARQPELVCCQCRGPALCQVLQELTHLCLTSCVEIPGDCDTLHTRSSSSSRERQSADAGVSAAAQGLPAGEGAGRDSNKVGGVRLCKTAPAGMQALCQEYACRTKPNGRASTLVHTSCCCLPAAAAHKQSHLLELLCAEVTCRAALCSQAPCSRHPEGTASPAKQAHEHPCACCR